MEGSWPEWIAAGATVIAVVAIPFGWLQRSIGSLRNQVAALEAYREAHEAADKLAHDGFRATSDEILHEVRMMRAENLEQHREAARNLDGAVKESRESDRRLHEKFDDLKDGMGALAVRVEGVSGRLDGREETDRRPAA